MRRGSQGQKSLQGHKAGMYAARLRRAWAGLLAVLLVAGLTATATAEQGPGASQQPGAGTAQQPAIKMDVKAGFEGSARFGEWLPVSIDVENSGPDVSAQIKIQTYWDQGPQSPVTEYTRSISLPQGAKKHVTMFVPAFRDSVTVSLVGADGKVLAQRSPMVMPPVMGVLAGVVSDSADTARFLSGINLGVTNRPYGVSTVRLAPEDIPEVSAALSAMHVLVLADTAPQKLTDRQWRAVEAWVSQGGVLILGGGTQARQVLEAAPASLRPVQVTGTATLQSAAALKQYLPAGSVARSVPEGRFVAATGTVDKGEILAKEGDVPLLVEYRYGKGTVLFSALDLAGEPLTTWDGTAGLFETLLRRAGLAMANVPWGGKFGPAPPGAGPGNPGRFMSQLNWVVRNMPSLEVPSLKTLGLLLFGYALLVGPLMYFVLRRFDRRDWAWVIVPIIAITAAGTVYGIGFAGKGRDYFTNTIAILRLEPGQRVAPVQSWVGVFAPSRSKFTVNVPEPALISPSADPGYYGPMPVAASGAGRPIMASVSEGATDSIDLLDWNVWTVRSFAVDEDVEVKGGIKGALTARVENPASGLSRYVMEGKITNDFDFTLEDVIILAGSAYQRVGDIPAGGTVDVQVGTVVNSGQQPYGQPVFYQIYNPGGGPSFNQENQRRLQILDAAFAYDNGAMPYPITFVGWTKNRLANVGLENREGRDHALTLVVTPLTFQQKPGEIVLPPGLAPGRLMEADNVRGGPAGPGRYFLEDGSMTFEIDPSLPGGTQVNSAAVVLSMNGGVPKVEAWNWRSNAWVEARQQGGADRWVPDGTIAEFIRSDDGVARVRVSGSGQPGDFSTPSLVMEGKVPAR